MGKIKLGVIGFGNRGRYMSSWMCKRNPEMQVAAVADVKFDTLLEKMKKDGLDTDRVKVFDNAKDLIESGSCDCIMIATYCSSHAEITEMALEKGLPIYAEKPVVTTIEDYKRLKTVREKHKDIPIVVSFPLRASQICIDIKKIIDRGDIGRVEQVQAYNNVPYGGVYFHSWYRNNDITQGQFLQKATHDLDYINFILGIKPVELCAMTSKRVFNGSEKAGIRCDECPKAETCPENPKAILDRNDEVFGDYCCYGEDCKNEDSGSVLIRYETGMHVNYTQNFYIKKKAEKRGARFLGDEGTLEFDWYRNQIKIYNHYNARIDTFQYDESLGSHFGGDDRLVDNFYNLVAGKATQSIATFEEGLDSALLCIRAKQSAEQSKFMKIQE